MHYYALLQSAQLQSAILNQMGNCSAQDLTHGAAQPSAANRGMVSQLKMTTYTDETSKIQLFNYESSKVHKHTYHIINNCIVFRADNFKKHIEGNVNYVVSEGDGKQPLFKVYKKHNYFKIEPFNYDDNETAVQPSLWLVVRSLPHKKYHIREKDIIKLGKQKIKIREMIHEEHHLHHAVIDLSHMQTKKRMYDEARYDERHVEKEREKENECEVKSIVSESQFTCRICLQAGEYTNPLICPCKCSGSVKYIHIKCLRMWLDTRLVIEHIDNITIVRWTPLTCEICKNHFKYRVFLDNIKYYTLSIPKPVKPYLVLQFVGKTAQFSRIFMFVTFSQKKVMTLGRMKNTDIRISEMSISRHHSNIFYDEIQKKFYLTDNESKFGTFAYIKDNVLANPHQKLISFQIGGELYSFEAFRGREEYNEYREEEKYLNVVEKGSEDVLSEESSQNEEEHEQFQDEMSSEEQEQALNEKVMPLKLTNIVSNIASLPTNQNLPDLEISHHNSSMNIIETNLALNLVL